MATSSCCCSLRKLLPHLGDFLQLNLSRAAFAGDRLELLAELVVFAQLPPTSAPGSGQHQAEDRGPLNGAATEHPRAAIGGRQNVDGCFHAALQASAESAIALPKRYG